MAPTCPTDYTCTFTLVHPRVISHAYGAWYNSSLGLVLLTVVVVVAIVCLSWAIAVAVEHHYKNRGDLRAAEERKLERAHKLAIEEQRTMQADIAKGNPDMLKLIRQDP